jgi:apolipoprotein N-acyltransferase
VTEYLETDPMLAARLGDLAKRTGADLLFGAPRYENGRTFNSIRLITHDGRNGGHYDKQHLVLLAERGFLAGPPPAEISDSPRRFSAGTDAGVLKSFVPIGVSVCHEIIYPDLVRRAVRGGAELLVNVSNDGWLDGGSGVASGQHFAMAAFRAVEARRYLVRGAITGISGIIDPYGRVEQRLEPHTSGVVFAHVAGRSAMTPYVRFGDAFAFACGIVTLALLALGSPLPIWHRKRLAAARFAS